MLQETKLNILPSEICQLDRELFNGLSPYSFLRSSNIYIFEKQKKIETQILKIEIKLFGGTYCESIDSETTHILISSAPSNNEIYEMKNQINLHNCKPAILSIDWILNCIKKKSLVDTCAFKLKYL